MSLEQYEYIRQELDTCPSIGIVKPSDLLMLPRVLRVVLNQAYREGKITSGAIAQGLGLELQESETITGILVEKGYLKVSSDEPGTFIARFGGLSSHSSGNMLDKI